MKDTLKVEIYMYPLCPITLANMEIYFSIIGEFKGTFLEGFIVKIHMSRNIPSVKKKVPVKNVLFDFHRTASPIIHLV